MTVGEQLAACLLVTLGLGGFLGCLAGYLIGFRAGVEYGRKR